MFAAVLVMLMGTDSSRSEILSLEEQFAKAARAIVRESPSSFPHLPSPARKWMSEGGFRVPQSHCVSATFEPHQPLHNVIHGRFDEDEQEDWAALCSRADTSWVVVFWDGSADSVSMLEPLHDPIHLQMMGPGEIGYSRILVVETPEEILARYREYEVKAPDSVTHDAIGDVFCGKGSSVHYWRNGRLESLMGED